MAVKDYVVKLQDSQGRTCELFIDGDSINALVASGVPLYQAKEESEDSAAWKAIRNGEIGEDAYVVA